MKPDHTIDQDYVKLSARRPVRAEAVPAQPDYPPHDHEFYEICVVAGGRAVHRTVDGDERLGRGSVVVMAPGQLHAFERTRGFSVVNLYYLAEWFLADAGASNGLDRLAPLFFQRALFPSDDPGGVMHIRLGEEATEACLQDLADLEREWRRVDAEVLFLEAAFLKCLVRMARALAEEGRMATPAAALPQAVLGGLALIEQAVRAGERLDVRAVARGAGMSFSHFCRSFRLNTGMTAGEYFQRRRIHRACRRLLAKDESATEIAHALGYADSAHFIRRFKQVTGLTPLAYRRKFGGG